jgi:hypothetical protein
MGVRLLIGREGRVRGPGKQNHNSVCPDFIKGGDFASVVAWIDNYCSAHPLDSIGTAALALVFELRSRAN